MKLTCYWHDCNNQSKDVSWLTYIWACIASLSLNPYVCPKHYDAFDEELS